MATNIREDQDWLTLLSFLPSGLDELAHSTGAIRRAREVRSGEDLLRLNLVYGQDDMSLRMTSAWARSTGLAQLSDVALLKRLRHSPPFLRAIVSSLLPKVSVPGSSLRLVALDATTVSRRRSSGTDFRVHVSYDLSRGQVCGIDLTDASGGERLTRGAVGPGDLVVGDRGYQGRSPLEEVHARGAEVVIRFHPSSLPMESPDGDRPDWLELAEGLDVGQVLDAPVRTVAARTAPSVEGRVIVLRKAAEEAEKDLKRLRKRAKEDRREVGAQAMRAAHFVFLFTTLSTEQADGRTVLETYRLRWQIEMLFKRTKGIVSLGELEAKDFELCEAMILSRLIVLLLIQAYETAFFPWGYPLHRGQPLAMA